MSKLHFEKNYTLSKKTIKAWFHMCASFPSRGKWHEDRQACFDFWDNSLLKLIYLWKHSLPRDNLCSGSNDVKEQHEKGKSLHLKFHELTH